MKDQFDGLTLEVYEREKQKHGNDHEAFVQALSAETDGWNTVKDSKKKDAEVEKSKAVKGRDAAAPAAGGQSRPEGISRAPNNGAGRGAPRPRPADAPARETRPPRVDSTAVRTPREVEARPATAPDSRPALRTPRLNSDAPKAAASPAASAPVVIKTASAPAVIKTPAPTVNKWQVGPSFVQQEKDKKLAKQAADEAQAQKEAALKAEDAEKEKRQQAIAMAKQQQQQREAPVASPKQSSSQTAAAAPKAAAPATAPAAAAPARAAAGGFKMSFQQTALHPSAEVQFGDMVSSESAQSSSAFQPQEQPSGYAATYNAAEGQAQGNGDAAALNGTFMQGHAGGPRYQQQQAKPAAHQQHMPHQLSYGGFWNPQMMYAMGNPSMYGHMAMPMMPFPYPQGYPQQGMYGQQPHNSNYRHGKNQGHNSQSAHGGAQHPGGVAPAHHYQQQQQQATYAAAFPAAEGQEGTLDATQQQQHKEAQQQYFQGHASQQSWQSKAAGKPGAGMVGHHPDYPAYTVPYWSGAAQNFVPQLQQQQQQQQQQQHGSSASAQAWHSNP
jgi:hypothetical protein